MVDTSFFGYSAIQKAAESLTASYTSGLGLVMTGAKAVAVSFILLNWIKDYIENMKDRPTDEPRLPIHPKSLIYGILYIAVVCQYNNISDGLDSALGAFDDSIQNLIEGVDGTTGAATMNNTFAEWDKNFTQDVMIEDGKTAEKGSDLNFSIFDSFGDMISKGFYGFLLIVVKGIAWLVNTVAYPIYLVERVGLLIMMKLLFPFILAIAAFEKFRDLFWRWIKVYCAIFLTGLLFVLVNWLSEGLFQALYANYKNTTLSGVSAGSGLIGEMGYLDRHLAELCFFTIISFCKVKLYAAAVSLSNRVLT